MFKTATKEDLSTVYGFLAAGNTEDTGYSATTILGWFAEREARLEITEDYVLLTAEIGGEPAFFAPLAKNKENFLKGIEAYEKLGVDRVISLNDWQAEIMRARGYECELNRDQCEYLYNSIDLIELSGKKYHAKRNFINSFEQPYVFRPYTAEDATDVLRLMCKWSYRHIDNGVEFCECDGWKIGDKLPELGEYDEELAALEHTMENIGDFNCFADVLIVEGKIAGFALGEIVPNGVGAIYFEKADITYKGIYPLLDNLFCRAHFGGVELVNKQEDMGLEGLRKSKESYHPVKMANRYTATRRQ